MCNYEWQSNHSCSRLLLLFTRTVKILFIRSVTLCPLPVIFHAIVCVLQYDCVKGLFAVSVQDYSVINGAIWQQPIVAGHLIVTLVGQDVGGVVDNVVFRYLVGAVVFYGQPAS